MSDPTTVLVVDDNRSAADALGIVLRRNNYVAEVAYDGVSALSRLRAGGVENFRIKKKKKKKRKVKKK